LLMNIQAASIEAAERAQASVMDAITFGDPPAACTGHARTSAVVEVVRLP